ncbi:hypothetical protein OSJ77_07710 [Phyllobacterium sp. 0TCS1.6C]|uniref:hypothetical protein n=2 Tax=Phyllobacterium TaxID=28100 RepID=UPI002263B2E8|nr:MULTISPECIES: hypothetical protein [unclassified Phyllobacterium]MCX8280071.1 hypothetical protein [Phyllobacterium sp. 0TCS1.6C]MCX8294367.1 hypothetical protein [Phyllobacterium sp. 0TCS1.6A]
MSLALVATNRIGTKVADGQQSMLEVIRRHKTALKQHESLIERCEEASLAGEECSKLEQRLLAAEIAEQHARAAFFSHPVKTMEDVAAKARHVRSFLHEEEPDKSEIDMLMRSLEFPAMAASRKKQRSRCA